MPDRSAWPNVRPGRLPDVEPIDRRKFLAATGAATVVLGLGPYTEKAWASPGFPDYPFALGVSSGDLLPDGVVLWTRLAPKPLAEDGKGGMPDMTVPVWWEVAQDERFHRVVRRGLSLARPELAHSVHVEVTGLRPRREYFYRFAVTGEISPVGRTKTTAEAGTPLSALVFGFVSCQYYGAGYYTAYRHMANDDLDFVVHLGDYIYENFRTTGVRGHDVPDYVTRESVTLDEYRNRYALYLTDPDLQEVHRQFPFVVTWDDHEVENNYADEISEDDDPVEQFLVRRANAYRANYEHLPLRRTSVPRGPDMRLYRRFTVGDLAEFTVLDTRQYRDHQVAEGDPARLDPGRTLTGDAQERWLLDGLAASGTTWNVLAQQIFMAQWDFQTGAGQLFCMDCWDGYAASRDRVLGFVEQRDIANPVVITGDVHSNWANDLKADFNDPASRILGVEFVGTSVSSGGDGFDTDKYDQAVVAENPHIKFSNRQRGYVRCTLTPQQCQADYRVVPYVSEPGARMYTRMSFVTEAGNPGLQQVAATDVPSRPVSAFEPELDVDKKVRAKEKRGYS